MSGRRFGRHQNGDGLHLATKRLTCDTGSFIQEMLQLLNVVWEDDWEGQGKSKREWGGRGADKKQVTLRKHGKCAVHT